MMPEIEKFALMTSVSKYSSRKSEIDMVQKRSVCAISVGAKAEELLAEIDQLADVARLHAGRVGRGAHQQRLDEAALPRHVARIAVVGLGIPRREPRELATMRVVVAVVGEVVAVAGEDRAALIGDDLQAEARQFEVAHDLRAGTASRHRSSWNRGSPASASGWSPAPPTQSFFSTTSTSRPARCR